MKTQYQAVDDPVLISIRKYIMKRAIKERGNHACLIWRSMFYFGHRIAILSTNNPIIKKTDASPRFVKRRGNLSILQHYLQNHLHCSQLLNKINFTDLMASAFSTFNFTVRNDVLLSDSELLFRNQHVSFFSWFSFLCSIHRRRPRQLYRFWVFFRSSAAVRQHP